MRSQPPVNTASLVFVDPSQAVDAAAFDPTSSYAAYGIDPAYAAAYALPPPVDPRVLDPTRYWLLGQLEWWFSVDNLCRDLFLRSKVRSSPASYPARLCH